MEDEREITQSFPAVEPPPARPAGPPPGPPPGPLAGPPVPPPPGPPPRFLVDDVWPWLVALLVVVVGGLLVWLFVFHNGKNAKPVVPAVVGLQQQVAIKRLTDDGYGVKAFVEPASRPRGIVVSQTPGGGSQLDKGATVTLHISNGRHVGVTTAPAKTTTTAPSTQTATAPATTAKVPDVVGQDMASGAGQVESAGFVADTDPVTSSSAPEGQIVQEAPAAGSQAPAGGIVQLQVAVGSTGTQVQVPNVVGQKAGAARAALLAAKLTARTQYRKGTAGVVLAQSPAAGGQAPAYTQVTITVGQ
ncbi:MAG: eukaryotic-like serine/threonine-protein kinase [Gaiellaceae bacterium]|nr:eukaryotic-like serine/threonine-protein kinase [Gaiellaceae bacterium]